MPRLLDETHAVYFISTYGRATPTFHAYGRIADRGDGSRILADTADVTVCGRVLYDGQVRYQALLETRHALKFGKPCHRCFQ